MTEKTAEEQFPEIDPGELREALAILRLPKGRRAGSTAAVVTVELTTLQAQFLAARGKRRFGLTGEAAMKREIETLISQDVSVGLRAMYARFSPWLHLIQMAKMGPQLERLRNAVRGR